jgi:hypothetical protein
VRFFFFLAKDIIFVWGTYATSVVLSAVWALVSTFGLNAVLSVLVKNVDRYYCRLYSLAASRFPSNSPWLIRCGFNLPPATEAAVAAVVDPLRQYFASAAPLSESVPSANTMGTVLPTAASSAVLYTARALSFGLIGLLERGGQRDSELVIGLVVS